MQRQIDPAKNSPRFGTIEEHYEWGFGVLRNFYNVEHTALDVAQQFYHAKQKGYLSKNDHVNFNNRWLQFTGDFIGRTKDVVDTLKANYNFTNAHVYANWVRDGHSYGRHTDQMDVIILQMWGETAYCCESIYGEKAHSSCTLKPGDAIFIRNGVHHTPIILDERMSISFSWV